MQLADNLANVRADHDNHRRKHISSWSEKTNVLMPVLLFFSWRTLYSSPGILSRQMFK
jgi:hypothetical protein